MDSSLKRRPLLGGFFPKEEVSPGWGSPREERRLPWVETLLGKRGGYPGCCYSCYCGVAWRDGGCTVVYREGWCTQGVYRARVVPPGYTTCLPCAVRLSSGC